MQHWDVSQVTIMYDVFYINFDNKINHCNIPDIGGWDVSKVTNFVSNLLTCEKFNLI